MIIYFQWGIITLLTIKNKSLKVEYTFGFIQTDKKELRIQFACIPLYPSTNLKLESESTSLLYP